MLNSWGHNKWRKHRLTVLRRTFVWLTSHWTVCVVDVVHLGRNAASIAWPCVPHPNPGNVGIQNKLHRMTNDTWSLVPLYTLCQAPDPNAVAMQRNKSVIGSALPPSATSSWCTTHPAHPAKHLRHLGEIHATHPACAAHAAHHVLQRGHVGHATSSATAAHHLH